MLQLTPVNCHLTTVMFRWKRKQVVVGALEHDYRHGFQHVMPKTEPGEIPASHWSTRPGT